jgi:hypothetical protein
LPWVVKGTAALCTCRKECNKYDLTASQCFWLGHHNDWSRWFALSSPPPICCPSSFSFIGGVAKEYITKLGCEKYFPKGHILSTAGDALRQALRQSLLKQDRWPTKHSKQQQDHSMTLMSRMVNSPSFFFFFKIHVQQTHFGEYWECMIMAGRLWNILWSTKWHNLPPQTYYYYYYYYYYYLEGAKIP